MVNIGVIQRVKFDGRRALFHIHPCKGFDLSKESEIKKCFHFTNLRPLWKTDNRRKSGKPAVEQLALL